MFDYQICNIIIIRILLFMPPLEYWNSTKLDNSKAWILQTQATINCVAESTNILLRFTSCTNIS